MPQANNAFTRVLRESETHAGCSLHHSLLLQSFPDPNQGVARCPHTRKHSTVTSSASLTKHEHYEKEEKKGQKRPENPQSSHPLSQYFTGSPALHEALGGARGRFPPTPSQPHLPSLASCAGLSSVMTCGRSGRRCRSPSASFILPGPSPRPRPRPLPAPGPAQLGFGGACVLGSPGAALRWPPRGLREAPGEAPGSPSEARSRLSAAPPVSAPSRSPPVIHQGALGHRAGGRGEGKLQK